MAQDDEERFKAMHRIKQVKAHKRHLILNEAQKKVIFNMIQKKAYYLSLQWPHTSAEENWLIAEKRVLNEYKHVIYP